MDIADSFQKVTEEVLMRMACEVQRRTGQNNLVLAGGVALNAVANGRLLREGPFEELWIQPAAGDAGGALGAALFVWHQVLERPRRHGGRDAMGGAFLGPEYSDIEIAAYLERVGAVAEELTDEELVDRVARLLNQEKVIGWFRGRMEFGPRALGARSIIGDARSPRMQAQMNLKIKFREGFRPFAPAVLRDQVGEWFQFDGDSPYMLLVADVQPSKRLPVPEASRALW